MTLPPEVEKRFDNLFVTINHPGGLKIEFLNQDDPKIIEGGE